VLFWVFSAAVNNLPEPDTTSSGWYRWLYGFLTAIAGHLQDWVNARRKPQQQPSILGPGDARK
jgi:hypothetical protein